jgi:5'(3')-deoxyribonucleotidase
MDGVLADFFTAALRKMNAREEATRGLPISPEIYRDYQEFDMAKVFDCSPATFWQTIDRPGFWQTMHPMPHARQLMEKLKLTNLPIYIASSPSMSPHCIPEKIAWLYHHFKIKVNQCMFGSAKQLMARPDALLIDDLEKNCLAFRTAGGRAAHVPSNWNTNNLSFAHIWEPISNQLYV